MRVIISLLLLCLVGAVSGQVAQTFVISGQTNFQSWTVDNVVNAALNVSVGNVYAFNITFDNTATHPFAFSTSNTGSTFAVDPDFVVTQKGGCTASGSGWIRATGETVCTVWLNVTQSAAGKTIYYRCTNHPAMNGPITVAAAAATTSPPTGTPTPTAAAGTPTPTAAGTTPPPTNTPITGGTLSGTDFKITGGDSTNGWLFSDNGKTYYNPTLTIPAGSNVKFTLSNGNGQHPFGISEKKDSGVGDNTNFFPNEINSGLSPSSNDQTVCKLSTNSKTYASASTTTPCVLTIKADDKAGTYYYRCAFHDKMMGQINLVKSSASTIAGAGMAIVIAMIVALFA